PVRVVREGAVRCGFQFGEERAVCGFRLGAVEQPGEQLETTNARRIGPRDACPTGRVAEVTGDGVFGTSHRVRSSRWFRETISRNRSFGAAPGNTPGLA